MRCCDSREPVETETSEAGPMSFCSTARGWEAGCGLYIWKIPKLHSRLAGIQEVVPELCLLTKTA